MFSKISSSHEYWVMSKSKKKKKITKKLSSEQFIFNKFTSKLFEIN